MCSKIHKVRFYNPEPQSINCVSYNRNSKRVAVGRKEASIEVWDINHAPFLLTFIPGVENGSVEALCWADDRLFSTGLGGALVEWDLVTLCMKKSVLLTGYAAWCLDVDSSNSTVAVGTEQGYINLYSLEDNDIVYKCLFDKQEGRIMCCKFDKTGSILVTGSVDTIRIWNVQTGHAVNRISASRRGKEVIIWCLGVLSDNTIVSGDSLGRLTFWDSAVGDQIESFTTHKADILAVTVSDDEKSIYCSGVDPTIVNFIKVDMGNKSQPGSHWVKNVQRHVHEHDVRALILQGKKLLSVGADGYLTFSSYPPKWVMRVPPMLPAPRSSASTNKLLLLRYHNHLEVWKLGSYAVKENGKLVFAENKVKINDMIDNRREQSLEQDTAIVKEKRGQPLRTASNPVKLVSVQSKGKKQLKCAELSPNGQLIMYSTDTNIRMLKLEVDEDDDNNVSLSKVLIDALPASTCENIAFTNDSSSVVISSSSTLYVLQIDPQTGASMQQSIPTAKYLKGAGIVRVCTGGAAGAWVAATSAAGGAALWRRQDGGSSYQHHATLPTYTCVPCAMAIHPTHQTLIITYTDQKLVEYDMVNKKYKEWPNTKLPKYWHSRTSVINAIHLHPQKPDVIIFQDNLSLSILEKKSFTEESPEPPIKKSGKVNQDKFDLRVIPFKYLSGYHWLGDDEAVLVEILPEHIVSQLPPAMATKKFGS